MVLGAATGQANTAVARQLGVKLETVGKWRTRFLSTRLDGLLDEPRRITDADVERAVRQTLESKPADATHWSTRSLAAACGLSRSAVHRIWRAFALQPHRTDSVEFRKFLDTLDAVVPADLDVHLIVDNYGTHKTALIRRWLAKRPRFHLHFTPTGASWLNLVERWFALLTEKQNQAGRAPDRARAEARNHAVPGPDQRDPQAVRVDEDGRRNPRERRPVLSANL